MKISELEDKQANVNIDVKIIYDKMPEQSKWGRNIKTVVVVDVDAENSEVSALLDLYDDDISKYKFGDKIKLVKCFAKEITTKKGKQILLTYGFANGELIGHYEKID